MSKFSSNLSVLIVGELLIKRLEKLCLENFKSVYTANNGEEGFKKFCKFSPSIVLTDIDLRIKDGINMIIDIKKVSNEALNIIIAEVTEDNLLNAIDIKVDKFIPIATKPEDVIKIIDSLAKDRLHKIVQLDENTTFDLITKKLIRDNVEIPLTKKELAFVSLLASRDGTLVLHEDIKKSVWINEKVSDAAIRTFIKRLRDKVGSDFIINIPGLGYKILTLK